MNLSAQEPSTSQASEDYNELRLTQHSGEAAATDPVSSPPDVTHRLQIETGDH
jgi:hypothetical protein